MVNEIEQLGKMTLGSLPHLWLISSSRDEGYALPRGNSVARTLDQTEETIALLPYAKVGKKLVENIFHIDCACDSTQF